jgi:hypothetical protein
MRRAASNLLFWLRKNTPVTFSEELFGIGFNLHRELSSIQVSGKHIPVDLIKSPS